MSYTGTGTYTPYYYSETAPIYFWITVSGGNGSITWNGTTLSPSPTIGVNTTDVSHGGYDYNRGSFQKHIPGDKFAPELKWYQVRRRSQSQSYTRSVGYTRIGYYTRIGGYTGNFIGNYSRAFTRNRLANYARSFAGNFGGNFTGNYTRISILNRSSNYSRSFLVTLLVTILVTILVYQSETS